MTTDIAVKERPIDFSPQMVRAIFADTKTQTRRGVKPEPIESHQNPPLCGEPGKLYVCPDYFPTEATPGRVMVHCESPGIYHCMGSKEFIEEFFPYGRVGDRLWVREQAKIFDVINERSHEKSVRLTYAADNRMSDFIPWPERLTYQPTPGRSVVRGIFREAARLLLEITNVRLERLQAISEHDAIAEGVEFELPAGAIPDNINYPKDFGNWLPDKQDEWFKRTARATYMAQCTAASNALKAFESLWESIPGGGAWAANPWVWAITFRKC